MASNYDATDLNFPWTGDYVIDNNGDLKDTSSDGLLSLIDQLHDICASAFRDWELYPSRGASLDDYMGEPNNRVTANRIHDRLRVSITSAGLVREEDLTIKVIPVHKHKVLVILVVSAIATPNNNLEEGQKLTISFVYDSVEQERLFLDKTPQLTAF